MSLIKKTFILTFFVVIAGFSSHALAQDMMDDDAELAIPPELYELEYIPKLNSIVDDEETGLPFDIRLEAMREAALSYGARGGLAHRTYEIRMDLDRRSSYLDKVFNFRQLLIPAPSGLLIEPPIVSESSNAMIINGSGREAAVADKIYSISRNAQIVSTARHWRNYLERQWGEFRINRWDGRNRRVREYPHRCARRWPWHRLR